MRNLLFSLFILAVCLSSCNRHKETDNGMTRDEIIISATLKGREIAAEMQKLLGFNLKKTIRSEGIPQALKFCNIHAYDLVDSLESYYHVKIKRASRYFRNSRDAPDENEAEIITGYMEEMKNGNTPTPHVQLSESQVHFSQAIIMNDQLCLKCHGTIGTDIDDRNYQIIKALYPDDKATGHRIGDLRGIWSITFDAGFFKEKK